MIKIEFSLAVSLYLILTACAILLWGVFERKKSFSGLSSDKNFFWQCNICTYVYVDSRHNLISKCPRCESFNKKEE